MARCTRTDAEPQKTLPANDRTLARRRRASARHGALGIERVACSLTMSCRRSGIMNNTPSRPPISARKHAPYFVFGEAHEDQRRQREDDTGGDRFPPIRWSARYYFENRQLTERPQDGNRQHGDGNRCGNREPGARDPTYTETAPNSAPKIAPRITARQLNSVIVLDAST